MRFVAGGLAAVALVVAGCASDQPSPPNVVVGQTTTVVRATPVPDKAMEPLPAFADYEPGAEEQFPNAKRVAGRAAQRLLTYDAGTSRAAIAAGLGLGPQATADLARTLTGAVTPNSSSAAEVIYPQMAGSTDSTFGAMVVVRQMLQDARGRRRAVVRTVDVRLKRSGGPWTVEKIASVGGTPAERPRDLPELAARVVDSERITLSDTARWDIYRGGVDPALLESLVRAAEQHRFSVAVLSSGHPRNVWQTDRRSAHSSGFAADIYAVDGKLVVRQPMVETAAYALARTFAGRGVRQLGSPWDFDGPGRTSFTDAVHQDHLHVQQTAVGQAG